MKRIALAPIVVEILCLASLARQRLQRIAGIAPKQQSAVKPKSYSAFTNK